MAKTTLTISGMTCAHCKRAVEDALENLAGVQAATVNLKKNTADVTYDDSQVTIEQMKKAIEEEGYEVK